ncbi:MAG: carboxypeptidase-like regulatory domain-containing protein [Bacteroidota bacterium]
MKKIFIVTSAALLSFCLLLTGCTGYSSSTKDNITIKDNLALHGSCIVSGKVLDNNTNEPIRGANIVVFSKPMSTVTDLYGQFEIIDILPGTYTLQVFCVGYVQRDIPDIEAKPDRLIKLDIRLEPRPVHGE